MLCLEHATGGQEGIDDQNLILVEYTAVPGDTGIWKGKDGGSAYACGSYMRFKDCQGWAMAPQVMDSSLFSVMPKIDLHERMYGSTKDIGAIGTLKKVQ